MPHNFRCKKHNCVHNNNHNTFMAINISSKVNKKMFIRIKKIKGKPYAYKIENVWTKKGSRQKGTKYLGKVVEPMKKEDFPFDVSDNSDYKDSAKKLIKRELSRHGFNEELKLENVNVNIEEKKVREKNKSVVIKMNEGYLCDETLKKVVEYVPSQGKHEEEIGYELAEVFVNAGINVEKEMFLKLFEKANKGSGLI